MSDDARLDIYLTDDGVRLDDGGWIAWPECDGTIRRFDKFGHWRETVRSDDPRHAEWHGLFPLDTIEVEYTVTYRTTLRLPKGRYQLAAELANVRPPEDACNQPVGDPVLTRVEKNGRKISVRPDAA